VYDDPDLGVVAISEPQGHPKQLNVDPNIRGEIVDLREALTFDNMTKLVLLPSFSSFITNNDASRSLFHGLYCRRANRQKRELFISVVRSPIGKCYMSNVTVIPSGDIKKFSVMLIFQFVCSHLFSNNYSSSGKAWVFRYITRSIFLELFGTVTVQHNRLCLTDEDPSEYRTFETNTVVDDNYKRSKVMLCTFDAIWKPFKENIRPRLPKDSGGLLLSAIARKYGKSQ
jgi:hypothetical protein